MGSGILVFEKLRGIQMNLDMHDDKGYFHLRKFAAEGKLPEHIKNEKVLTAEELQLLPDGDFALVIIDKKGETHRKFPLCDRPNVWMTTLYFGKNSGSLPPRARSIAAKNILNRLQEEPFMYHKELDKARDELYKARDLYPDNALVGNIYRNDEKNEDGVDPEAAESLKATKESRAKLADADYALVVERDGSKHRLFPINTPELVKRAEKYFDENFRLFHLEHRRKYAAAVWEKAKTFENVKVASPVLRSYASDSYAEHVDLSVAARIRMAKTAEEKTAYEKLASLKNTLPVGKFAEYLFELDRACGLDKAYGKTLLNAFESSFNVKEAGAFNNSTIFNGKTVFSNELQGLDLGDLGGMIDQDTLDEMHSDPINVFNSLPVPYKDMILQVLGK
jgi:hypothetical protein